ncbi:hypothetical protein [Candidatus Viridilinea mediisalina]|uniref:Uncharacterized protein n=1 Tax=Candidatus Viridilinea mediisalina TaxID=2024553 RepID=A0A2A6RJV4_9CHLR|nr:hypothetical protein [Candidatus Viridilinea mediisalina]PDW03138.1 hypothetical protein CJ255_10510 [Candidatus Viridilinea mediisalina]
MNQETETIGPLVFGENADYPYPFGVERPPRFWMEETTGTLGAAVEVYMRGEPLNAAQLEVLQIYLRQYLERTVMAEDGDRRRFLERVGRLRTVGDLTRLAESLSEAGVEPF